jgi:hypothetical protein
MPIVQLAFGLLDRPAGGGNICPLYSTLPGARLEGTKKLGGAKESWGDGRTGVAFRTDLSLILDSMK